MMLVLALTKEAGCVEPIDMELSIDNDEVTDDELGHGKAVT